MGRAVMLNEEMKTARDIAGSSRNGSDKVLFAKTMRHPPTQGRSATPWMAAALLAMTWIWEAQAFPDQVRHLADANYATAARNFDSDGTVGHGAFEALPPGKGGNDKSVQVAQVTTSDAGQSPELQRLEQERKWLEENWVDLEAWLQTSLQQERERSARLQQDLAAARREVESQTAVAAKASEEASRLKQAGEKGAAELQKSLQQERERSARLEQDLAAAQRDVETETALAAKASKELLQRKQAAEAGAAELKQLMQKERERADALAQDHSMARSAIFAYEAQTRKAIDEAAELRQAAANGAPSLRKVAQDERERAERLEQNLAAARREVETQTALAAKASEEAAPARQAAEREPAGSRSSLKERRVTPKAVTVGSIAREKSVEENATAVADRTPAAGGRGDAQPNSEEAAAARLVVRASALLKQGDIGAARMMLERAAEMGSAQANFSLAETYDPLILSKWRAYGTRGNAIKAQDLYAKAAAAGIKDAKARFEALRR